MPPRAWKWRALIGPDLSDIGAIRKPAAIQLSLMQPSTAMQAINRPVRFVTRDGRTVEGRRLNEDTATVQLIDRQGQLVSLSKSDIRDTQLGTKSRDAALMPASSSIVRSRTCWHIFFH